MPRSRLVDFNKFRYNLKVTRGGHEFRHESTGTRAQGTKAQVLDMLYFIHVKTLISFSEGDLSTIPQSFKVLGHVG